MLNPPLDFDVAHQHAQFPQKNPVNGVMQQHLRGASDGRELVGDLSNWGVPRMTAQVDMHQLAMTPQALSEPIRLGAPELVTDYGVTLRGL